MGSLEGGESVAYASGMAAAAAILTAFAPRVLVLPAASYHGVRSLVADLAPSTGIELRSGRVSYYLEYKFTWASIAAALTGDSGAKNVDLPSILGVLEGPADLVRQLTRWWRGEEPKYGRIETRLSSHQIFAGAGYAWPRGSGP